MFDLHFESCERVHEGDGDVGVKIVATSLELRVRISSDFDNLKIKMFINKYYLEWGRHATSKRKGQK